MPWRRDDAIIVLASYFDRPRGMRLPPTEERRRLASVLRRDIDAVTDLLWAFDAAREGTAGGLAGRVWREFVDTPLECAIRADEVLAARRKVPHYLRHSGP